MTTLPVPLSAFRANIPKYLAMLTDGVEIHVTKHGRTVAVVRKPEDVAKVEDTPGVDVKLMERLMSGEGEPDRPAPTIIDFEVTWREPADGAVSHVAADLSTGPDITATTLLHRDEAGVVSVVDVGLFDLLVGGK